MFKKNIIITAFILISSLSIFAQNLEDGKALLRNESFRKAIEVFKKINTPEANFYLGEAYYESGKFDSAKIAYMNGIKEDNEFGLNYAGLAKVDFKENNPSEAENNINKAKEIANEKNIPIYQAIADAYISSGKDNSLKAKDYLEKAITMTHKKQKKDKRTFILLGDMYFTLNDGSQAVANYRKAIDLDSSAVALVGIGKIFNNIRNYGEAEISFDAALKIDPNYSVAYKELSDLQFNLKKYDEAIANWKKYVHLSEDSPENDKHLVNMVYLSKDYQGAAQLLTELAQKNPDNSYYQQLLAYSYAQLNDTTNGIQAFKRYFEIAKQDKLVSSDYEYYGKLLVSVGNDSLAAEQFLNAVRLDTNKTELYTAVLQTYSKLKKPEKVIELVREKQSKTTLNSLDYFEFGRALYTLKDFAPADSAFAKFVELKPDIHIGYLYRARVNASLDPESEKGLAKPFYEQAIPIMEKDTVKYKNELIEAYSYLGYYYYLQNDLPTMKDWWKNVLALDPTNKQAKEAINFKGNGKTGKKK